MSTNDGLVTVSDIVLASWQSQTIPRWAVTATFVGIDGAAPRCVDYRVRVLPTPPKNTRDPGMWGVHAGNRVLTQMEQSAIAPDEADDLGEVPPEGIPRHVFEAASQVRLLEKARALAARRPQKVEATARALLQRPKRRPGRPPSRSLPEKLAILADIETAFAQGRTLAEVGEDHNMSRSSVRDLLSWARHDASPPLFVSPGPGRRGGHLTPEARAMLGQITHDEEG